MKKTICLLLIFVASFGYSYAGNPYSFKHDKGYRGFLDYGYTIGLSDFKHFGRLDLSTSHGYQFSRYFFLGVGAGYQFCDVLEMPIIPVFVDARLNLMDGRISPYIGLKAGYSFDIGTDNRDKFEGAGMGFYFVPNIGVRMVLRKNLAANLSFGYTHQIIDYIDNSILINTINNDKESWEGLTIKAGIEF